LVGFHPLVPLLAEHLRRRYPGIDLIWRAGAAEAALDAIARADAHVAGLERLDAGDARDGLAILTAHLGDHVRVVQVATSEHGLVLRQGTAGSAVDVAELARSGARVVN